MRSPSSPVHDAAAGDELAAALVALGWLVFPVKVDKTPRTLHGFKDATNDASAVRAWMCQWPGTGLAVATGAVSGLVVLDVDPDHGGDDALHDLEREHGELPQTVEAHTGGGGRHLYFQHPAHEVRNSAGKLGPGLDIRGDGGYCVLPPAPHPSGRRYAWSVDGDPADVTPAPMPAWLLDRLTSDSRSGESRGVEFWRELVTNGVRHGARNDSCARLTGHLLARGVDPFVTLELVTAWDTHRNRPPLGPVEVHGVVRSIARREVARWS